MKTYPERKPGAAIAEREGCCWLDLFFPPAFLFLIKFPDWTPCSKVVPQKRGHKQEWGCPYALRSSHHGACHGQLWSWENLFPYFFDRIISLKIFSILIDAISKLSVRNKLVLGKTSHLVRDVLYLGKVNIRHQSKMKAFPSPILLHPCAFALPPPFLALHVLFCHSHPPSAPLSLPPHQAFLLTRFYAKITTLIWVRNSPQVLSLRPC